MAYLGLDIGTTTCKATVIGQGGGVISSAQAEYDLVMPKPGYIELNGDVIWENVKAVIKKAVGASNEPVKSIATASFGEAFVPMDGNGKVLANSIIFSDIRGTEEVNDILAKFSEAEIYGIAGVPINTIYSLNKLLWLKKHDRKLYDGAKMFPLYCDYIAFRLSGERKLDYSLASRTMMLDCRARAWSDRIMDAFEIDKRKFSEPVQSGTVVGTVLPSVAAELGLMPGVILVAGGHDQICAALGAGVLKRGDSVDGIGTTECLTVLLRDHGNQDVMRKNNFCIEPYALPGEHVTLGFSNTAGAVLKWYRNNLERERYQAASQAGADIYAIMESECPEGPTDLLVQPHFAGSGTPYMDSSSVGALVGLKLSTTRGDIYKACIEGNCLEMMLNAELLEQSGTRVENVTCAGGGSRSAMQLQIKADVMGLPVKKLRQLESGTIALAMLGAVACGDYRTLEDAAAQFVGIERTFEPDAKKHEIYMEKYQAYKRMYAGIKQIGV